MFGPELWRQAKFFHDTARDNKQTVVVYFTTFCAKFTLGLSAIIRFRLAIGDGPKLVISVLALHT